MKYFHSFCSPKVGGLLQEAVTFLPVAGIVFVRAVLIVGGAALVRHQVRVLGPAQHHPSAAARPQPVGIDRDTDLPDEGGRPESGL